MDFSIIVVILLAIALFFGALSGLRKGLNHSILRLILIIGCIIVAVKLTPMIREMILEIKIKDGTLGEMIGSLLSDGEQDAPEEMIKIVNAIMTAASALIYIIAFFVLRFLSYIIIFPICKIFVKRDLIKKRLLGTLVGLIQGVVIAFAVLVPLNGILIELGSVVSSEEGQSFIKLPAELNLDSYKDTEISKFLTSIGEDFYQLTIK